MSRILLQTTIPAHPDDWDITRFSLLADELRAAEPEVTEIKADPSRLAIFKDYGRNIATWLQPEASMPHDEYDQRIPAHQ
jgi:hypothetical protein